MLVTHKVTYQGCNTSQPVGRHSCLGGAEVHNHHRRLLSACLFIHFHNDLGLTKAAPLIISGMPRNRQTSHQAHQVRHKFIVHYIKLLIEIRWAYAVLYPCII